MGSKTSAVALSFVAVLFVAAGSVSADEIIMNNGDHITGTITGADGGKMTISTPLEGDITVNLSDVKTFSTDEPIKIQMADGTVIDQKVDQGKPGQVVTAEGGTLAPQPVAIANVDKINPPPPAWNGSIVLNALYNRGNTTNLQAGAAVNAIRRTVLDRITFNAQYQTASQRVAGTQTTTADNWFLAGKYDLFFSQQFYGNAFTRVEKDRINDLDLRLTPGGGVGYQWYEEPQLNFDTEAGLAWVYQDYTTEPTASEQFSARLAYHVDASFWGTNLKVFHDVQFFPSIQNVSNILLITDLGFHVALTKTMFSEIKAEWDYNSQPATGTSRNNITYILGLGWNF
ncbi:MAG: DUF481 domain-containing protein [Tepidisphaeraceae bacterium]